MKAEHIHEALDLLPEDLIEKVDRLRSGKAHSPNRLYKNLSAIAACLALLILGSFAIGTLSGGWGGSTERADMSMPLNSAAPETFDETGAAASSQIADTVESDPGTCDCAGTVYAVTARYVSTGVEPIFTDHPETLLLRSRQELREFCAGESDMELIQALDAYDEAFFAECDLLVADLACGSSSLVHQVHTLLPIGDDQWQLQVTRITPQEQTDDLVQWYALTELEKDLIQLGDSITLSLINEEE